MKKEKMWNNRNAGLEWVDMKAWLHSWIAA
jgi:hypothetical protein